MTAQSEMWDLLTFDKADRMRRALRVSDVGVQEMADYLGVARNTVSTWINGRIVPNRQTMRLWALRTGVPLEWLETGDLPGGGPGVKSTGSPLRLVRPSGVIAGPWAEAVAS